MPVKARKVPLRMCVFCREMKPKKELIRVVASAGENTDGAKSVRIDEKGKLPGRGAYICLSAACFAGARKSRALERNLECQIPESIWTELEGKLKTGGEA